MVAALEPAAALPSEPEVIGPAAPDATEKKPPAKADAASEVQAVKQEFGETSLAKTEIQTTDSTSSLEAMVQAAVRKVLLEGGANASALLGGVNTGAVLAKVKQEQQEDEDSDCVIEDEIPAPNHQASAAQIP